MGGGGGGGEFGTGSGGSLAVATTVFTGEVDVVYGT